MGFLSQGGFGLREHFQVVLNAYTRYTHAKTAPHCEYTKLLFPESHVISFLFIIWFLFSDLRNGNQVQGLCGDVRLGLAAGLQLQASRNETRGHGEAPMTSPKRPRNVSHTYLCEVL